MTGLHHLGNLLRNFLLAVPLPWVRALFVTSLVLLLIWVLRLPRERTTPGRAEARWDENLKLWAGIALAIQILIYSFL